MNSVPNWFSNFINESMNSAGNPDMDLLVKNMPKYDSEFKNLQSDLDNKMKINSKKKITLK